jgi:16S rRNA (cytosine967-C5)-methyltransferase
LKRVKENCARLGVTCAEIRGRRGDEDQSSTPPPALSTPPSSEFDRILVDAPCSNTGVLRRRVDLRWRLQAADIERLRATQLGLLNQAAAMLKPGGVLVYSTCSLEPEENAGVVDEFLLGHSGFQLETTRQLLPFADGVDGAYVARLKRT